MLSRLLLPESSANLTPLFTGDTAFLSDVMTHYVAYPPDFDSDTVHAKLASSFLAVSRVYGHITLLQRTTTLFAPFQKYSVCYPAVLFTCIPGSRECDTGIYFSEACSNWSRTGSFSISAIFSRISQECHQECVRMPHRKNATNPLKCQSF